MVGHEIQGNPGVTVLVVFGPVQRHDDAATLPHEPGDRSREHLIHRDVLVAQQAIDLLDAVLFVRSVRSSQRAPDVGHRKPLGVHRAHCRLRQ